jgi:hypothetical protein
MIAGVLKQLRNVKKRAMEIAVNKGKRAVGGRKHM